MCEHAKSGSAFDHSSPTPVPTARRTALALCSLYMHIYVPLSLLTDAFAFDNRSTLMIHAVSLPSCRRRPPRFQLHPQSRPRHPRVAQVAASTFKHLTFRVRLIPPSLDVCWHLSRPQPTDHRYTPYTYIDGLALCSIRRTIAAVPIQYRKPPCNPYSGSLPPLSFLPFNLHLVKQAG